MYLTGTELVHISYLIALLFHMLGIKRKGITLLDDIVTCREIILCWLQEVSRMMAVTCWSHLCPLDEYWSAMRSWKVNGELMLCKHNSLWPQIITYSSSDNIFYNHSDWVEQFKTGKQGVIRDSGWPFGCEACKLLCMTDSLIFQGGRWGGNTLKWCW